MRGDTEMGIRKILFVTLGAICVLTGCTGNTTISSSSPSAASSPSTSKSDEDKILSPSANASPVYQEGSSKGPAKNVPLPKMPIEARNFTEEGASSFVEYYFGLLNYTIESNDAKAVKRLSSEE